MDLMIPLAHCVSVASLALWLTTGVRDNLLYPSLNETFTAEVMEMTRLQADYPEAYALVAHRRVSNRRLQRLAFRLVVGWELASTIMLWIGVIALGGALFGVVAEDAAQALGMAGALMFVSTWTGFLIVGNHFSYWFGHEGAQNTHFQMTLWGLAVLILLAAT